MLFPTLDTIKGSLFKYAPEVYLRRGFYKAIFHLSRNRTFNYLNYRYALKKIKKRSGKPPESLAIESTTLCNAKCTMCGLPDMRRVKGPMSQELFEKIAKDASRSGIGLICLNNIGEPLMDERLFERIRLLKKYGLKVMLHTNGSLLDEERGRLMLETGVDNVGISLDAFSKETYERIRIGLSFKEVVENTMNLVEMKKRKNARSPLIKVNFAIQDANIHEVRSFYDFWHNKVDHVNVNLAHDWAGTFGVKSYASYHINNSPPTLNPCRALWKEMIVLNDGRVSLCCFDYAGSTIMGDLKTQGIMEVWQGERFQEYRKKHIENKRKSLPLCKSCSRYCLWF